MSHAKFSRSQRVDPRGPFVFDIRSLGSASARSEARTVPAPADFGAGLVRIPRGSPLELDVQLEEVSDGVLVTTRVSAELAGECARCLVDFTSHAVVSFQELFSAEPGEGDGDGYLLDGDRLDLEPALRDALVLDLPLSPLCSADCAGLCAECGVRLAEAEPGHSHPGDDGVWAVLKGLFPESVAGEQEEDPRERAEGEAGGESARASRRARRRADRGAGFATREGGALKAPGGEREGLRERAEGERDGGPGVA